MGELDPDLKSVPDEYFSESFKLNKNLFKINSGDQAKTLNDNLNRYLEVVETNLVKNIQENFDFFTDAFNNFDGMKEDLRIISEKAMLMKGANAKIKK